MEWPFGAYRMQGALQFFRRRNPDEPSLLVTVDERALVFARPDHGVGMGLELHCVRTTYIPTGDHVGDPGDSLSLPHWHDMLEFDLKLTAAMMASDIRAFDAASANGAGRYVFVAVTADPERMVTLVESLPAPNMGRIECERLDGVSVLRDGFLPNAEEVNQAQDIQVIMTLKDQGDDCQTPREIIHAFFGPREKLDALRARLSEGTTRFAADTTLEYVVTDMCTFDVINQVTMKLSTMGKEFGVEYDGWLSPVVAGRGAE